MVMMLKMELGTMELFSLNDAWAGQGRRRMTMGERAFHSYAITCTALYYTVLKKYSS